MSGFDKDWLALRETADIAARNKDLVGRLGHVLMDEPAVIVDIGCGTGSSVRAFSALLPASLNPVWRLVDYDAGLLDEAKRQLGEIGITFHQLDLNKLEDLPLKGASLLSASAFFDLASAKLCEDIARAVVHENCAFYAALNYDGIMRWSDPHPLDADVVRDFNLHQRMDKGLGPALGPQAVAHLTGVFGSLGYRTFTAPSPWVLGQDEAALQRELLKGMVAPVLEIGRLEQSQLDDWMQFRSQRINQSVSCEVGHLDLLALPNV